MTRIGIIRETIVAEGGREPIKCGTHYFADGPHSGSAYHYSASHRKANETIYKVDNLYDGLTVEARKRVVEALKLHPDVKTAYLSRKYDQSEGHLKVVFDGTAR